MALNRKRPRRLRQSASLRDLVEETSLKNNDLIWPLFLVEGKKKRIPISSMPGVERLSQDELLREAEDALKLGLKAIALFPVIADSLKDSKASEALNPKGLLPECVRAIKKRFPELLVITDVAMDPYSSDGHDGLVRNSKILNDETLVILAKMALLQAEAGADIVAPSDMMDGRVGFIREALDKKSFHDVSIMSYTAKYASAFYGPFRDALDSAPRFGDKKTYQMNPANKREALRELRLDIKEGADFVMVKPALCYLDIISELKRHSEVPVVAYQVSGEYAMLRAAADKKWLDYDKALMESLLSIKRAGADLILSYAAKYVAKKL